MDKTWDEKELLSSVTNQFGIYQINEESPAREYMFESKGYLDRMGFDVSRDNYDLVYTAPWTEEDDLEKIFVRFNIDRPEDFKGHSLSMSDIVLVHENGENTAYYVDTIGFAEIPGFLPDLADIEHDAQEMVTDGMVPEAEAKRYISEFKAMTGQYFHEIGSMKHDDFEAAAMAQMAGILEDYSINATITDVTVVGKRARGIEDPDDPVNVLIGIAGYVDAAELKELFEREPLVSGGIRVEAQIVPVSEACGFEVYLAQEQATIAQMQAQYAIDHDLPEEDILAAQISAFIASSGIGASVTETDAAAIADDIKKRDTAHLTDFFTQMQSDSDPARAAMAKEYLEKLRSYKPLAKIEELVEQNYNMIDDRLDNLKSPDDKRREEAAKDKGRGKAAETSRSLRRRLKEKRTILSQQEKKHMPPSMRGADAMHQEP